MASATEKLRPHVVRTSPMKRGSVLWDAVRKSMPAFVARPLRQRFLKQRAPRFMIDPETKPKMGWDLLVTCCVLYTTCVVPYRVCFKRDATGGFATFEALLDLFFGIDIVLNFLTGVHLPSGEITYEEKVVARSYLRGWFFVDFFSTIPFDNFSKWFGSGEGGTSGGGKAATALASAKLLRSLKILRLFKLARIRKLNKMFLSLEDAVFTNQSLLSLCKLALSMLFLSHLVACLWFVIGSHPPTPTSISWVTDYGFDKEEAVLQYLVSVYWAIVTMVTIGYGDILARNNLERIFAIAIMAVGVSFFGYVIGTITTLVSNLNVAAALYDERITVVKEYIISRGLPVHLSKRIRDHFEYYYQNRSVFKEKTVLKRLPSAMRNEMIHHRHAKIVSNVKYFAQCHESLISDIVMQMTPFNVLKDEYVYVQHEIAAHVFFLLKGKVTLTKTVSVATAKGHAPGGEWRLAAISVGEHFGELEVYDHEHGNGVRICSAIAKSYCELTFLSRQAISKISTSWPEVLRHFRDAARETSKRMRRRVEKQPSVRHTSIEEKDELDDDDEDDKNGDGEGEDTVNADGEVAKSLFHDEEMEAKMMRSTLLAHKTMRANVKKPGRTSRVSPFMGPDDTQQHLIMNPKTIEPVQPHAQTVCFAEHDQNAMVVAEKGDLVESLSTAEVSAIVAPTMDDRHNDSSPALMPTTPTGATATPQQLVATPQPTRSRLVLESLLLEKIKPAQPTSESSDAKFDDFGSISQRLAQDPTIQTDSMTETVAAKYQIPSDGNNSTPVDAEKPPADTLRAMSLLSGVGSSTMSIVYVEEEGDDDDEEEEEDDGGSEKPKPPVTATEAPPVSLSSTPATNDAAAKSALLLLGRLQSKPLASSANDTQPKSVWKKAVVTAVAVERKSQDSRRNLNEILAKIRGSSNTKPKANLHAEQLMLHAAYVLHPQERGVLTWQLVIGVAIMYSIIVVPFRLGFNAEALGGWLMLENMIDCFFGFDILLNFCTAFFDEERILVFDKRAIFWKYVRGWFIVDFLSTVPIDDLATAALSSGGSGRALSFFPTKLLRLFRVARLLKLARLMKLSRVAGRLRDLIQLSPSTERLSKLLLVMTLFCHWNACAFHAAMLASESSGMGNWCADYFHNQWNPLGSSMNSSSSSSSSSSSDAEPQSSFCSERVSPQDRYIVAVYWAFTTFTTVGYGDIKPSVYSTYELGLVILLIVINATVYGFIISAVVTLIKNLNPSDREYRLRITEMKDYLQDSSVSIRLGAHIKTHYQHILMSTSLFPEEKLFNKMSPSLRFDLARLVAGETLFAIPLITVMEDSFKGFVSYALFLMKPMCICRSEKVCRSGGPGTEMFFLVEGQCDLVNSQTNEGCIIGTNAVFEQYSLMVPDGEIYRTVSTVTAISKKCVLYSLAIQDFRVLEDVSPAVSTYFLSQLAAVLIEDDLFTLTPTQHANVERALRNGRVFKAVAEQHEKARLTSVSTVALAQLAVPRRKGSEWAPDLLPRALNRMENASPRESPLDGAPQAPLSSV